MIDRVKVSKVNNHLELIVYYKSGKVKCYTKDKTVAKYQKGISLVPKTVVNFMRENPNKVTFWKSHPSAGGQAVRKENMINTNNVVGFYTDVFGNEVNEYEQINRYTVCKSFMKMVVICFGSRFYSKSNCKF